MEQEGWVLCRIYYGTVRLQWALTFAEFEERV